MRVFWFLALLFLLTGINAVCYRADDLEARQVEAGCTQLSGGLIHCPAKTETKP